LIWSVNTAVLAREHNNANIAAIGARQHSIDEALLFIDTFIRTPFSGDERHIRRIAQIAEYENTGAISGFSIGS
jgi:ribose 5-phosphate isomerase B